MSQNLDFLQNQKATEEIRMRFLKFVLKSKSVILKRKKCVKIYLNIFIPFHSKKTKRKT